MKNYTISQSIFNEFNEVIETLEYLETNFPGFLRDSIDDYAVNGEDTLEKNRFSVIAAYRKKLNNLRASGSSMERLFHSSEKGISDLLVKHFTIDADELIKYGVSISDAVKDKFIIEYKTIHLSKDEATVISYLLKSRFCTDNVKDHDIKSILAKLGE
jgi:hypothetical protein